MKFDIQTVTTGVVTLLIGLLLWQVVVQPFVTGNRSNG